MSAALDPEIVVVVAEVEVVAAEEEVVAEAAAVVAAAAGSVIEGGQEIAKDLDDSEPCHFYLVC